MIKEEFLKLLKEDADFRRQIEEILGISFIADINNTLKKVIESIDKLRDSVNQLVEAQRKSEERLAKLEEIAANHESRLAKLEELQSENEKRIRELIEAQKRSEERLARLEEAIERLSDAQKRNEESIRELIEAQKKTEERLAAFQEATEKRFEELEKKTEEKFSEIEKILKENAEQIAKLTETIREHDKILGSIGRRWGRDYENIVKLFFKEVLDQEGIDYNYINKFTYKDDNGIYGYKGKRYEIDIFAKDHKVYLIEVKSTADFDDVEWFDLKTRVIIDALKLQGEIVRLFLAITVTKGALETAKRYGIRLIYNDVIEVKDEEGDVVSG